MGRSKHWGESLTWIDPQYRQTVAGPTHLHQLPSTRLEQSNGEKVSTWLIPTSRWRASTWRPKNPAVSERELAQPWRERASPKRLRAITMIKSQHFHQAAYSSNQLQSNAVLSSNRFLYQATMGNYPPIITSNLTLHHCIARMGTDSIPAQPWGERASPKLLVSIAVIEGG